MGSLSGYNFNIFQFFYVLLGEHLATIKVNWHQVCNTISYKMNVLERQILSEEKMGRGSPLWKIA